jgi:hypothetical protein
MDGHRPSLFGQLQGDRPADAAGSASDEHAFLAHERESTEGLESLDKQNLHIVEA